LDLVDVVVDAGVSAHTEMAKRPGGAKLLNAIKRKNVQAVVAMKLDRCFRNSVDALQTTTAWDKANIALHLIDLGGQSINTSTAMGKFLLTMLAATAEMERNLIAERTKTALQHKKANGEKVSAHAPIGFRIEGQRVVEDEKEQIAVAMIRKLSALSYKPSKIAAVLNDKGVPARGKRWYASSVQAALA
jgi:DNA invertase Pin-like site-specific DNA recombinase